MEQAETAATRSKDALKALRAQRKGYIQAATARMRAQKKIIAAITTHLANGAGTIPDIAAAIGSDTAETLWYIAALKKYGQVVEAQKDGDFFTYALSEAATAAPEA